jgi:hypothetical protein
LSEKDPERIHGIQLIHRKDIRQRDTDDPGVCQDDDDADDR